MGVLMMPTGTGVRKVWVQAYDRYGYGYRYTLGTERVYIRASNENFIVTCTVYVLTIYD